MKPDDDVTFVTPDIITVEEALGQPETQLILIIVRGPRIPEPPDLPLIPGEDRKSWRARLLQQMREISDPIVTPHIQRARDTGAYVVNNPVLTGTIVCRGTPSVLRRLVETFGTDNVLIDTYLP